MFNLTTIKDYMIIINSTVLIRVACFVDNLSSW